MSEQLKRNPASEFALDSMYVRAERVGKYFHLKDRDKVLAIVDIQKVGGLSDEDTALFVARLDENRVLLVARQNEQKESDEVSK